VNASFSIIVPTCGRPDSLRTTLSALLAIDYEPTRYQLIIVNDGADSATAGVVASLRGPGPEVTLQTIDRRGAASARNRGASIADGDVLLFVDDDIVVQRDHLIQHLRTRASFGTPLVNGAWRFAPPVERALRETPFGRFRLELEDRFQGEARGRHLVDGCYEMGILGTWNLAVGREHFWDLGGFDEAFPAAGAEDQDFSLRALSAGAQLVLDAKITCLHNDDRLTLRAYCAREERSATTMPLLAHKHQAAAGTKYILENRPIGRDDPLPTRAKKLAKTALARRAWLRALHRLVDFLERADAPEWLLRRFYTALLGLHLFRGFRSAWGDGA
jgi:glycosyltransferase involved in cell wall biosynthesis